MRLIMTLFGDNTTLEATFQFSGSNRQPHEPVIFMFKEYLNIEVVYDPEQFNTPIFLFESQKCAGYIFKRYQNIQDMIVTSQYGNQNIKEMKCSGMLPIETRL